MGWPQAHRHLHRPCGGRSVEIEGRREVAVSGDLRFQIGDLLLRDGNGIGPGDKAARWWLLARNNDECSRELSWVAGLLAILGFPKLKLRRSAFVIILDGRLGVLRRLLGEEFRAEEPRVDNGGCDAERRDLRVQRLHPALKAELRRGIRGTELEAYEPRCRGDRNNVPRALLAHDRQDSAGDVHRAYEARRQLALDLLQRQLLEVSGIKAGSIVDQHVNATEPVDSGPHGRLGIGAAGDVQLDGQQVARLAQDPRHGSAVPAGRHNRVTGYKGGFGEIDAHASAGSSDKPNLFVTHDTSVPRRVRCCWAYSPQIHFSMDSSSWLVGKPDKSSSRTSHGRLAH